MFAEAAFWKDNNTFMVVGYSMLHVETLFIYMYNMKEGTLKEYNLLIEEGKYSGYMNVNMKERGISTDKTNNERNERE